MDDSALTKDADSARIEVVRYHGGRGEKMTDDIRVSRPAGIVSAREDNARGLACFRGNEQLRKNYGR